MRHEFRVFFEITDALALERQWRYRRAFWSAYLEKGHIQEARALFAQEGAKRARARFGGDVVITELTRGSSKQVDAKHAVLLMRIGRLVIADWSHNGKCVIWVDGDQGAPSLLQQRCTSDDLNARSGSFSQAHLSPDSYGWQNKVQGWIEREAGISLSPLKYRVEGQA